MYYATLKTLPTYIHLYSKLIVNLAVKHFPSLPYSTTQHSVSYKARENVCIV